MQTLWDQVNSGLKTDKDLDGLTDCADPDYESLPCNGGICSGGVCPQCPPCPKAGRTCNMIRWGKKWNTLQ